mgnify:FL=1
MATYIIKLKNADEYVSYNDYWAFKYVITHNKSSAKKFLSKKEAKNVIDSYYLELNLMSELEIIKLEK